jgi:hypothetical protein
MKTLNGRRLFFATRADLVPGLRTVEQAEALQFMVDEMRDDTGFTVIDALSAHPALGSSIGNSVIASPRYRIFRRGEIPTPREVPQRRGGVKYLIEPTSNSLRLICGGVYAATGALLAGELQQSVNANRRTTELFEHVGCELFRGFTRVRLYAVGQEALARLRAGHRLATIGVESPREYDLAEER